MYNLICSINNNYIINKFIQFCFNLNTVLKICNNQTLLLLSKLSASQAQFVALNCHLCSYFRKSIWWMSVLNTDYLSSFIIQVRDQIQSQVKNMIIKYRDDLDLKNLVDWVQQDWVSSVVHFSLILMATFVCVFTAEKNMDSWTCIVFWCFSNSLKNTWTPEISNMVIDSTNHLSF